MPLPPPLAPPGPAHLVQVRGRVRLYRDHKWDAAKPGMALETGDRLRAGSDGRARIRYWDGVEVIVEPDSLVEVLDRAAPEDEALQLFLGEVLVEIRRRAAAGATGTTTAAPPPFRIRTPRAVAGAEGTIFRVKVGRQGQSRVAVLEGKVRLTEPESGQQVLVAPETQAAVSARGRLREAQPLMLPFYGVTPALARRERTDEPFFGELGRFRSNRFLGLVDLRRDALNNPARVRRLLQGEGYEVLQATTSPRQGGSEDYDQVDLRGTPRRGVQDTTEAVDSEFLQRYQALDDGRWAAALGLRRVNLRVASEDHPVTPAGPTVLRGAVLEAAEVSGLVQRAWQVGEASVGASLSMRREDGDGTETLGGVGGSAAATAVTDERAVATLGLSFDHRGGKADLGVVVRYEDRDIGRVDESVKVAGAAALPGSDTLLARNAWTLEVLGRLRLGPSLTAGARGFFEQGRSRRRRNDLDRDPTQLRVEVPGRETAELVGLAAGLLWRPRRDSLFAADLSYQRSRVRGDWQPAGGLMTTAEDESRLGLHLGALRRWGDWDARVSWELERRKRTSEVVMLAGVGRPPAGSEAGWENRKAFILGRQLTSWQRLEFDFEEREPTRPERVLRLRLVRRF